jgi:hypothetical protein
VTKKSIHDCTQNNRTKSTQLGNSISGNAKRKEESKHNGTKPTTPAPGSSLGTGTKLINLVFPFFLFHQ